APNPVSGLDLSWDQYQGISYTTFYILRHHSSTGWIVIDSVPSTNITYNDPFPPSGILKYAVEIHAQNSCGISRGAINTSRSNIKVTSYTGIAENSFSNLFNIYPNPASNSINLSVEHAVSNVSVELRDMLGRLVFSEKSSSFKNKSIDVGTLSEGVYYLKVTGKDAEFTRKVIVQR
ncbi:MAG: T9SS type A sorting domain-containing protein, partial [Bacteroidia bacterium]